MSRRFIALLGALICAQMIGSTAALAKKDGKGKPAKPFIAEPVSAKQNIRFYKANKQLQADKISFVGDGVDATGCHNFRSKTRVFKALQIGFKSCSLYNAEDCDVSTLIPVHSEKQVHNTYLLTEGVAWFTEDANEQGAIARSWSCSMEIEQGEMRLEQGLTVREYSRLRRSEGEAREKLEAAQAEFNQAKKALDKARKYAKRAKQEAIAMGAIEPDEEEEEDEDEKHEGKNGDDQNQKENDK